MTAKYTGMNQAGTGVVTDADHVWQSCRDILLTPVGSRVMRREYGSLVQELIDAPKNEVTRMQAMSAIVIALTAWEPRIALNAVSISYSEKGAVEAHLSGLLTETMEPGAATITIRSGSNGDS